MVTQNKKILIITGSFGNGHLQVTQSIVNQLNDMIYLWKHIPSLRLYVRNGISIALNILEICIKTFIIVDQMN